MQTIARESKKGSIWHQLWASAVTFLNIQPRDAWSLTVSDFWMLWDAYLDKVQIQTGNNYTRPMTMNEFNELNSYLDELHGNN